MPTYTLEHIRQAQELAAKLELRGHEAFCSLTPEQLQVICNGIGAEWQPAIMRSILDKRHKTLRIAAMIHDMQYHFGAGTEEDFRQSNTNLYVNGCILAEHSYGWYNPLQYIVKHDAIKLANICNLFGKRAYYAAIETRKAQEGLPS